MSLLARPEGNFWKSLKCLAASLGQMTFEIISLAFILSRFWSLERQTENPTTYAKKAWNTNQWSSKYDFVFWTNYNNLTFVSFVTKQQTGLQITTKG